MVRKKSTYAQSYVKDIASTDKILQGQIKEMLDELDVKAVCVVSNFDGTSEEKNKFPRYYFKELNGVNLIYVCILEFTKTSEIYSI